MNKHVLHDVDTALKISLLIYYYLLIINPHNQASSITLVIFSCGMWDPASLIAQLVKNLPAMQETPVRFLGQEDPLEKG